MNRFDQPRHVPSGLPPQPDAVQPPQNPQPSTLRPSELSPARSNTASTPAVPSARTTSISSMAASMGVRISVEAPDAGKATEAAAAPATSVTGEPASPETTNSGGTDEPPTPPTDPGESTPDPGDLPPSAETREAFGRTLEAALETMPLSERRSLLVTQPVPEMTANEALAKSALPDTARTSRVTVECKEHTLRKTGEEPRTHTTIAVGKQYASVNNPKVWFDGVNKRPYPYPDSASSSGTGLRDPGPRPPSEFVDHATRGLLDEIISGPAAPDTSPELQAWTARVRDQTASTSELIDSQPPASNLIRHTSTPNIRFPNGTTVQYENVQRNSRDAAGAETGASDHLAITATLPNGFTYSYQQARTGDTQGERLYQGQLFQTVQERAADTGRVTEGGLQNLQRILAEAIDSRNHPNQNQ